jgi:hypothetical protein
MQLVAIRRFSAAELPPGLPQLEVLVAESECRGGREQGTDENRPTT